MTAVGREVGIARVAPDAIQEWDSATGEPIAPAINLPRSVAHALLVPSGLEWNLRPGAEYPLHIADSRPIDDLIGMSRLLTQRGVDEIGGVKAVPPEEIATLFLRLAPEYPLDFPGRSRDPGARRDEILASLRATASRADETLPFKLDYLNWLIAAGESDATLFTQRGEILVRLGRESEAEADFSKALEQGATADVWERRGGAHADRGDPEIAIGDLSRLIDSKPPDEILWKAFVGRAIARRVVMSGISLARTYSRPSP